MKPPASRPLLSDLARHLDEDQLLAIERGEAVYVPPAQLRRAWLKPWRRR